jgi:hypothetical protein
MMISSVGRAAGLLAFALGVPALLLGCPKKQAPVAVEEASAPPPASTPEVLELAPLVEDSGPPAPTGTGTKRATGGGGGSNQNQAKIQACCNAMRSQAKSLGPSSPEGSQLTIAAAQCDVFAKQVGPAGNAPEVGQLREMLKSLKLPAACNF